MKGGTTDSTLLTEPKCLNYALFSLCKNTVWLAYVSTEYTLSTFTIRMTSCRNVYPVDSCASCNRIWWVLAFFFTSDIITYNQNWQHLYLSSAGGNNLSNDTQIKVIGTVEPEICTIMQWNLTEKLGAKLPVTTHGYSMVKMGLSQWYFLGIFWTGRKSSRRWNTAAKR